MLEPDWQPLARHLKQSLLQSSNIKVHEPFLELTLSKGDIRNLIKSPAIPLKGITQMKYFHYRIQFISGKHIRVNVSTTDLLQALMVYELLIIEHVKLMSLTDLLNMGNFMSLFGLTLLCSSSNMIDEVHRVIEHRQSHAAQVLQSLSHHQPLLSPNNELQAAKCLLALHTGPIQTPPMSPGLSDANTITSPEFINMIHNYIDVQDTTMNEIHPCSPLSAMPINWEASDMVETESSDETKSCDSLIDVQYDVPDMMKRPMSAFDIVPNPIAFFIMLGLYSVYFNDSHLLYGSSSKPQVCHTI